MLFQLPNIIKRKPQQLSSERKKAALSNLSRDNYFAELLSQEEMAYELGSCIIINEPLRSVGGDGYCLIKDDQGGSFLILFDCMGHGHLASIMTRKCQQFIQKAIFDEKASLPSEVLQSVHKQIFMEFGSQQGVLGTGVDMGVVKFDPAKEQLTMAGAKTDMILVDGGDFHRVRGDRRSIGVHFDRLCAFEDHQIAYEELAHMRLFMFSDGLTDLFGGPSKKRLSSSGALKLLASSYDSDILLHKKAISKSIDQWEGLSERMDDLLIIGVELDEVYRV